MGTIKRSRIILSNQRLEVLMRSLKIGDIVEGTVVARIGKGRYVIAFQGHDFIASYAGFLKLNSRVQTIVQKVSPQVVFKILSGYALPLNLSEHEQNLTKVIQGSPGILSIQPHVAELCDEIKQTLETFNGLGFLRDEGKAMVRSMRKIVEQLSFMSQHNFIKSFCEYINSRMIFSSSSLVDFFKTITKTIASTRDEDYDTSTELIGGLGEAVKKLYLNLRLEQIINVESTMCRSGILYRQIPFMIDDVYYPITSYYVIYDDKVITKLVCRDETLIIFYYADTNAVVCRGDDHRVLSALVKQLCTLNNISVKYIVEGEIAVPSWCDENITIFDIVKPVKFDLVV